MQRYLIVLLLLLLAGCATTVASTHIYIPENGDGPDLLIGARAVNGFYQDDIFITINGEDVLSGDITLWRLQDSLAGTYQGKEIQADCSAINRGVSSQTRHFCTIYIEGAMVVRLAF